MDFNERKIQFVEHYLKLENEQLLTKLERVMRGNEAPKEKRISFKKYLGFLSKKEVSQLTKVIEEGCEKIDSNEWK